MMIAHNLEVIKDKITMAAHNAGRNPQDIKLVAVSKLFPVETIKEALIAGQLVFGENYIQELVTKRTLLPPQTIFHFIGHLQSNKAKYAAETCNMVETIDSFKLGKSLNNHLEKINKTLDILVQVNIGDDAKKAGVAATEVEQLLVQLNALPRLRVCGLMTIPPLASNPEDSRPHFRNLRILAKKLAEGGLFPHIAKPELSMGMSDDFHIAIDEGATIVRVGTAIFGHRQ